MRWTCKYKPMKSTTDHDSTRCLICLMQDSIVDTTFAFEGVTSIWTSRVAECITRLACNEWLHMTTQNWMVGHKIYETQKTLYKAKKDCSIYLQRVFNSFLIPRIKCVDYLSELRGTPLKVHLYIKRTKWVLMSLKPFISLTYTLINSLIKVTLLNTSQVKLLKILTSQYIENTFQNKKPQVITNRCKGIRKECF